MRACLPAQSAKTHQWQGRGYCVHNWGIGGTATLEPVNRRIRSHPAPLSSGILGVTPNTMAVSTHDITPLLSPLLSPVSSPLSSLLSSPHQAARTWSGVGGGGLGAAGAGGGEGAAGAAWSGGGGGRAGGLGRMYSAFADKVLTVCCNDSLCGFVDLVCGYLRLQRTIRCVDLWI